MIVKGRSRSGPEQLAAYLLRTDDGERPTLLRLDYATDSLQGALLDWHLVGQGTRGEKTLYHAQIAPETKYQMTPDQWRRAAEILAEELGMEKHGLALVVHEGDDKPHAHVVFQRVDVDSMTLWDNSKNFEKHERASKRMALEFGHELIPGKHAKRDRKKQEEFPRAETTQAEHQQAKRTDMTVDERKAQVTGIRATADNAPAFKAALEEAGYVLAKGDKRGFVLVDQDGEVFSLSKQVTDIKGKEFKAFMDPLDPEKLPSVDQAKEIQSKRPVKAEKQAPEASKFLPTEAPPAPVQPPPAPEKSKFLPPEVAAKVETAKPAEPPKKKGYDYGAYSPAGPVLVPASPPPPAPPQPKAPDLAEGPKPTWIKERVPLVPATPKQPGINFDTYAPKGPEPTARDVRDLSLKEEFNGLQPPASPPPPKPEPTIDPEIEVIRQRIFKRQQAENRTFLKVNAEAEREKAQAIERTAQNIAAANVDKMEVFDFQQRAALQAEIERHAPRKGARETLRKFFKPEDEEAKAAERREEMDLFRSQQAHDRRAYIKSLEESRDRTLNQMRDELKALRDQHQAEQRDRNKGYDEELARRLRERQKAIDLAREQSGWEKDFQKEQEHREDDPDVPRRGK